MKTFFWSSSIFGTNERIHKLSKSTDEQKVWETLLYTDGGQPPRRSPVLVRVKFVTGPYAFSNETNHF